MTEEEAREIIKNAKPIDLSAFQHSNTINMDDLPKKKKITFQDLMKKWQKKNKQKPEDNC